MQTAEITYRVITLTYILISEGELSTQIVKEIFSMKCQNYGHNPMLIHQGACSHGSNCTFNIFCECNLKSDFFANDAGSTTCAKLKIPLMAIQNAPVKFEMDCGT